MENSQQVRARLASVRDNDRYDAMAASLSGAICTFDMIAASVSLTVLSLL